MKHVFFFCHTDINKLDVIPQYSNLHSHNCKNPKSRTCDIKFQQKQFTSAGPIGYENLGVTVITTVERDVTMVAEKVPETPDTNSGSARPTVRQDIAVIVYCMAVAN
jgi:hypothetical protein